MVTDHPGSAGFLRGVWRQIRSRNLGTNLSYAFGRFHRVRGIYGGLRRTQQLVFPPEPTEQPTRRRLEPFSVVDAVDGVRSKAVFQPLVLDAQTVDELNELARSSPCTHWGDERVFHAGDVRAGRFPDGASAIVGEVSDAPRSPLVRAISEDPDLIEAVTKCLGFAPTHRYVRLLWSFVSDASPAERERAGQTIRYHFDVQSYSFLYANFYLTDVDIESGAHSMILGSHRAKPWRWLLGSANRSDEEILGHYGAPELVIEGPAGMGFLQDSSCYHKALIPRKRDRLMLQIRYF